MKKKLFIFIHFNNDFSGSPKILRDLIKSDKFKNEDKILITSNEKGFLDDIENKVTIHTISFPQFG